MTKQTRIPVGYVSTLLLLAAVGILCYELSTDMTTNIIVAVGCVISAGVLGYALGSRRLTDNANHREELERLKNEFVSTISHELRTPLTSTQGSLGLVVEGMTGDVPGDMKAMLDIAYTNTLRLSALIDDLLDMQKIESGALRLEWSVVELFPVLQEAIAKSEPQGSRPDVRFLIKESVPGAKVFGDKNRIGQALMNILSNAVKHSFPHRSVDIAMRRNNGAVRVSVTNAGDRIPDEFRKTIFDKFTQADSSDTRERGGSGLGLSIAKGIINKHGGRLDFTSDAKEGTTFFFELPEWSDEAPTLPGAGARRDKPEQP